MKWKMIAVSSVFLLFAICFSTDLYALELKHAQWLHQAVTNESKTLNQDVIGENAINIYLVSDSHISWSELLTYAEQESDYFLKSVPYSPLYNIIVVQVDDLGFYLFGQYGFPARTVRPVITSLINREYSSNEFLVYINGFENAGDVQTGGYDGIAPSETDGLDWEYVSVSLKRTVVGGVAHELGHLISGLADEYFALGTGRNWQLNYLTQNGGSVNKVNLYGDSNLISTGEIRNGEAINVNIVDIPKNKVPWASLIEEGTPLPTFRSPDISFGDISFWSGVFFAQDFPYFDRIGAFGFGGVLFAPTTGDCIMNSPDTRWGYCKVCKHAFSVQALLRTREVELSNQTQEIILPTLETVSPSTTKPLFAISLIETGNDHSICWLVNGVTDESKFNKTSWSNTELHDLIGKTLTLRVTNETAKENLVYNPYNPVIQSSDFVTSSPSGKLSSIYTEEYEWRIKEVVPPTATPTPLPSTPTPTHTPTHTPTVIPTPTPAQVSSVTVTQDKEQFGVYSVFWQWPNSAPNPNHWEVHVYQDTTFKSRVNPAPVGSVRNADITLDEPGMYMVYVAPVFDHVPNGLDFKPSSIEVLPAPTPSVPTSVEHWWIH